MIRFNILIIKYGVNINDAAIDKDNNLYLASSN